MRVLVYGQLPPPVHGSNVMTDLFLRALRENNYDVSHVNKDFSKHVSEIGKVSLIKLKRVITVWLQFFMKILNMRPSCVVYFNPVSPIGILADLIPLLICIASKTPVVLYSHGSGYGQIDNSLPAKFLYHHILNSCSGMILLSQKLRNDADFFLGRTYVLPNGLDIKQNSLVDLKKRKDFFRNGYDLTVLFVSNFIREKGAGQVIDAIEAMHKRGFQIKATLAGGIPDQEFYKELQDKIKSQCLEPMVCLRGPVYGDAKIDLFVSHDVFVFPTSYRNENFPLVCLEAMAAGMSIIATDIGAISDIVNDGENGYLIHLDEQNEFVNALMRYASDIDMRREHGTKSYSRFYDHFAFNRYRGNVNTIMKEICEDNGISYD